MSHASTKINDSADAWTEPALLQRLQAKIEVTVAITSTVRAARALRQRYSQWQHARGNAGWVTPTILAWDPWLATLWDAAVLGGGETRVLLTDAQELEIWRGVLAQDEAAQRTLSIPALAELAQSAWKQMNQYGIPLGKLRHDSGVDAKAFYAWATGFETICRESSYLSSSSIEATIAQSVRSHEIPLPEELILLGFDRMTPAQAQLIDALVARGSSVHRVKMQPAENATPTHAIVSAATSEQEIATAASWIREALLQNPRQRIGVIVSALEPMRGAIDAAFRRTLAPSSIDIRGQEATLPYEFSLGSPLHRLQPIRTALTLLQWLRGDLPPEDVSWLLVQGGFCGEQKGLEGESPSGSSRDARARLDRGFRERKFQLGGPVTLSAFRQWLAQTGDQEGCAALRWTFERFFVSAQRHGMERLRSCAEWREIVEELLATAEWHLLAPVDSRDYQLLRRWNAVLDNLSSLTGVAGQMRFSVMLERLQHLASHTIFTLETRNAPVQILGIAESAGLSFDAVWWMGAQVGVWPPQGKAQPLLPWNLQRAAHMPYADPTEDSAFALRTTQRILGSGKAVVVSFALETRDAENSRAHVPDREIVLAPPVRESLPHVAIAAAEEFLPARAQPRPLQDVSQQKIILERIYEEPAVPFQGSQIRGGVRFLELQAACPFRAFAELRLATRPLEELDPGLSAAAQGTVVHRVLERFWKEMKSREKLLKSTSEQHRERLRSDIGHALSGFFRHANEPWQQTLLQIEAERLEQRLMDWLEQEKQRPDFTVIGTEDTLDHSQLGGIAFECRIDRIDRVAQGIVLLDYKTGPVDAGSCEGDRPDKPQLPAYAVLRKQVEGMENPLAGVAFAGLHPRKVGFTVIGSLPSVFSPAAESAEDGVSEDESKPTSGRRSKLKNVDALIPEEMKQLLEIWSMTLNRLAEDFRAGTAVVDPKKQAETCRYCEQTLLCRIRETAGSAGNSGEEYPVKFFSTGNDEI